MIAEYYRRLSGVFSRRRTPAERPRDSISGTLRNKLLLLCRDVVEGRFSYDGREDVSDEFWFEMQRALQHLYGRSDLSRTSAHDPARDVELFVQACPPEELCDFIEKIFDIQCVWRVVSDENELVEAINCIFDSESAPYKLTSMIKHYEDAPPGSLFPGGKIITIAAYPKVVCADDDVIMTEAIAPALSVLSDPDYTTANAEFRDALNEYRKADYGDCLTKCGSAFESVMKIICTKKQWPFDSTATVAPLLQVVFANSNLEAFFREPLTLIATVRNRLSKSHGAGPARRIANRHIAQWAIASTAAAITFLVQGLT